MSIPVEAPPQVIGYERKTFVTHNPDKREFVCGIHGWPPLSFPNHDEPIWRGEVPEGAKCNVCGIDLKEL